MQRLASLLGFENAKRRALLECVFSLVAVVLFFLILSRKGPINDWTYMVLEGGQYIGVLMEAPQRIAVLFIFCAFLLAMLCYLALKKRWAWPTFLFAAMLCAVAIYMRMAVMNVKSGDYDGFLANWVEIFRKDGFSAITQEIGDYNLPYLYIIALIARSPINDLYLIKLVSIFFELLLAFLVMQTVARFMNEKFSLITLAVMLLLPTMWFNGSYWAQCDAIYVFFIIASLYLMLSDHPILSVAMLTIAFGFKLQTIFYFPMVMYGLYFKKYKLRHALVFPVVYLLLILPALVMGRSLWSTLTIYLNQAAQYNDRITFNAPNIYQFFPDVEIGYRQEWDILKFIPGTDKNAFDWAYTMDMMRRVSQALIPFAGLMVAGLLYYLFINRKYLKEGQVWTLALLFTLLMPLVLPKMHERYFMPAEVFAVLYGIRYRKRFYVPVMVCLSSFFSYYYFLFRNKLVDMRIASLMMIAAFCIVLWNLMKEFRQARREDPEVPREQLEVRYKL